MMKQTLALFGQSASLLGKALGFLLVFSACAGTLHAQSAPTPEIDPGAATDAVALVIGSVLLLTAMRRKR